MSRLLQALVLYTSYELSTSEPRVRARQLNHHDVPIQQQQHFIPMSRFETEQAAAHTRLMLSLVNVSTTTTNGNNKWHDIF